MSTQDGGNTAEDDLARIDRKADEFEQVWRRGQRPRIEDHLGEASGPFRMALVKELLMIEWQRRLNLGEQPSPEEYVSRFPEHARWIRQATLERDPSLRTTVGFDPTATPTSDQLPHLSDYEVLTKIGGVGMGIVYLARKRSRLDGGQVALKMIADHLLSRDNIERFVIEMRNQARLQHPHDDALMSPLTVAFAVLIVASAFWLRANQIIQTTFLAMAGYGLLALTYRLFHPSLDRPYRHFHYLAGLAILCVMLVYQANRTRDLARIGGERLRA